MSRQSCPPAVAVLLALLLPLCVRGATELPAPYVPSGFRSTILETDAGRRFDMSGPVVDGKEDVLVSVYMRYEVCGSEEQAKAAVNRMAAGLSNLRACDLGGAKGVMTTSEVNIQGARISQSRSFSAVVQQGRLAFRVQATGSDLKVFRDLGGGRIQSTLVKPAPSFGELQGYASSFYYAVEKYLNEQGKFRPGATVGPVFTSAVPAGTTSGKRPEPAAPGDDPFAAPDGVIPYGVSGVAGGVAALLALLTAAGMLAGGGTQSAEIVAQMSAATGKPQGMWAEGKQWTDQWGWVFPDQKKYLQQMERMPLNPWDGKDPPQDGMKSAAGLVWSGYWKDWVTAADYSHTQSQLHMGKIWGGNDGWVTPAEKATYDANAEILRRGSAGQDAGVKAAHDAWLKSKQDGEALRARHERINELRDQVDVDEARSEYLRDHYSKEVWKIYEERVNRELDEVHDAVGDTAAAFFRTTGTFCRNSYRALSKGETWRYMGRAAVGTVRDMAKAAVVNVRDLVCSPLQSTGKLFTFLDDAAVKANAAVMGAAKAVVVQVVTHPVDTVKMLTGIESFEKAMDPDIPLAKRMGYAVMGAFDSSLALTGSGLVKTGARTVNLAADAAKASELLDAAKDALRATDPERLRLWQIAEVQGRNKVIGFGNAVRNGDPQLIRQAALEVQGDKRALQFINKGHPDVLKACGADSAEDVIKVFKKEMDDVYRHADDLTKKELLEQAHAAGKPIEKIEVVSASNPSKAIKAGADRDITYRITQNGRTFDVPAKQLQEVYDRNLLKVTKGGTYDDLVRKLGKEAEGGPATLDDLLRRDALANARKLDQTAVDRLSADAYGRNAGDLDVALHRPGADFSDVTAVGKTVAYKGHEWFKDAEKLAGAGTQAGKVEAEKFLSEGMRQVTKQFDNQLIRRYEALGNLGTAGLQPIPEHLRVGVELMRQVEKGVPPAVVERALKGMKLTPTTLATQVGEYIEAMQKLRPPGVVPGGISPLLGIKLARDATMLAAGQQPTE